MAIFKRGMVYWYHFYFNGQHVQKSSKQSNPRECEEGSPEVPLPLGSSHLWSRAGSA